MTDAVRYYQTRFQPDPRRAKVWRVICGWLQREVPCEAHVLDLGAGYCDFINQIQAARKVALDLADQVRFAAAPGVETHVGSCTDLSFAGDGAFDIVFASNLFEHLTLPNLELTLSEVHRVLRPNGKLIVMQPNFRYCYREYFDDYTHVMIYTHRSLCDVLRGAGLKPERVHPRFLPYSMKSRLPSAPALVWLYLRSPIKPFAGQMLVVARKSLV
ncbi:MAG: class I SAM-dependent methyltransferase [Verrucomicrobiae bacterium]|nr:class I SAM-dependent methyltransferase [Verrucomicrobiae bacterium]